MKTPTGANPPRWIYLIVKPLETIGLMEILARLFGQPHRRAAWLAVAIYVGAGIVAWYRKRSRVLDLKPGHLVGDVVYHGVLSLPAVALVATRGGVPMRWALVLLCALVWWWLDTNGYGPMRDPATSP